MDKSRSGLVRLCALMTSAVLLCAAPQTARGGFGKIGSEFQVNTTSIEFEGNASIAPQTDGGFTVVWDTGNFLFTEANVLSQSFDAAANAVGSEVMLNQTTAGVQATASSGSGYGRRTARWTHVLPLRNLVQRSARGL